MRRKIWEKDDFFQMGGERIDMDPSVVEIEQGIPVVWGYNWTQTPAGRFFDIRIEDGEITGEIEWFSDNEKYETLLDDGVIRFGGYFTKVERNEDGSVVTKCCLSGVALLPISVMPKPKEK